MGRDTTKSWGLCSFDRIPKGGILLNSCNPDVGFVPSSVHTFRVKGIHFAYDSFSMDAFKLDPISWHILCGMRKRTNIQSISSKRMFDRCIRRLVRMKLIKQEQQPAPTASPVPSNRNNNMVIKAVDFHVTHNCNMRCKYCYGLNESVDYLRNAHDMNVQTAHDAVDFLAKHADPKQGLNIVFFGGEPLTNFPVIRETVRYAKRVFEEQEKRLSFSITTNGTIMSDEILDLMNVEKFSIMVSLDGPKQVQDILRPMRDGQSSYDRVIPNIQLLLKSRNGRVTSRATICSINTDLVALAKHSKDVGFAHAVLSPESKVLTHEYQNNLRAIMSSYEKLTDHIVASCVEGTPHIVEPFRQLLLTLFVNEKRLYPCWAGRTYVAVSPTGDIYPCHRFMGDAKCKIGSIYSGIAPEKTEVYWHRNSMEARACSKCWVKFLCAGGCAHTHYQNTNDSAATSREECRIIRRIVELGVCTAFQIQERAGAQLERWMQAEKTFFERRMKMLYA